MDGILSVLFIVAFIYLIVWLIKVLIKNAAHVPTWGGIIISAILGMLPLYLILCFFGIMGEPRNITSDDTQNHTGGYAKEMSKRYAYNNSKRKIWLKFIVVGFIVMCLFFIGLYHYSDKQEVETPIEALVPDNTEIKEQQKTTPIVNKKSSVKKQEAKQNSSNIKQEGNGGSKSNVREKSTLELLEERNHANVVKQAKEAGVSTEGSTLDILERMNHANVVKQAKEAGVSTEGSTLDILERINHVNVVKQAQELGVSTEGSTFEILERITRKKLERDM